MSSTCQFLGQSLIAWHSKKQNSIALSMAEDEYTIAGACCVQLLWIIQQIDDLVIAHKCTVIVVKIKYRSLWTKSKLPSLLY